MVRHLAFCSTLSSILLFVSFQDSYFEVKLSRPFFCTICFCPKNASCTVNQIQKSYLAFCSYIKLVVSCIQLHTSNIGEGHWYLTSFGVKGKLSITLTLSRHCHSLRWGSSSQVRHLGGSTTVISKLGKVLHHYIEGDGDFPMGPHTSHWNIKQWGGIFLLQCL